MSEPQGYVSTIPAEATAKPTGKYPNKRPTRIEYYLGAELVGLRVLSYNGDLELEYSYRNGKAHGWQYRWDEPGKLLSATSYENGVEHGTAYQWADDGRLIGSYTMEHGTGRDLWWGEFDGIVTLAEAYQMVEGLRHGYEWLFYPGEAGILTIEKQSFRGKQHGIERDWDRSGKLSPGYPQFWISNQPVTEQQYIRAAAEDATLPLFRPEDNQPHRDFPVEVAASLQIEIESTSHSG